MGTIQPEYIIVKTYYDDAGVKEIDKFIKDNNDSEIFLKGKRQANGFISYFMDWDGSKEGWDTSNKFDKLRLRFITLCKKVLKVGTIIRIVPSGDNIEVGFIEERDTY